MKFFKKIFFVVTMAIVFFWNVAPAMAEKAVKVDFNPLCWEKKECQDTRVQFVGASNAKSNEGWLEKVSPCDKEGWGLCLPVNATKAQVSFGGNADFSDAGVYIKTVYNYSLIIIGILAVVMLIISGAQWITSAGNAEAIGAAKKRITGAIIGLFIAYMSYNILMSINPATINLRLPQIYMIRQQILGTKWCSEMKEGQMFAWGTDQTKQSDKIEAKEDTVFNLQYVASDPEKKFWCGQRFFIEGAPATAYCWGNRCDSGTMCSDAEPVDESNPNSCIAANVVGEIKGFVGGTIEGIAQQTITMKATWEDLDDDIEMYLACDDGTEDGKSVSVDVKSNSIFTDPNETKMSFVVGATTEDLDEAVEECGGGAKVWGAFLVMNFTMNVSAEFTGEDHCLGVGGKEIWAAPDGVGDAADEFLIDHPGWFKHNLFISLASIRAGYTMPTFDVNDNLVEAWGDEAGWFDVSDNNLLYKAYQKNMTKTLTPDEIDAID